MNFVDILKKLEELEKSSVKEAVHVTTDTPEEAAAIRELLNAAGMQEQGEETLDDDYANRPEEEVHPLDAMMSQGSDLNKPKKMFRKEFLGDNPMAVPSQFESVKHQLTKAYQNFKTR